MIVGGGDASYIQHLRELASESGMARERIRFSPFVENAALAPLFQAADVGVWPGNHSQVMYEAIASGLPMVLPDRFSSYGTSDFLLANVNGIAFPRGEVDKLRVGLERLAANAELRREMGQRSRALAEREFSWPAIARRFVRVARVASDSSGASVPTAPSTDSC